MPQPFGRLLSAWHFMGFTGPLFFGTNQDLLSLPDMFFQRSLRVKNSSHSHPTVSASCQWSVPYMCWSWETGYNPSLPGCLHAYSTRQARSYPRALAPAVSSARNTLLLACLLQISAQMSSSKTGLHNLFFFFKLASLSYLSSVIFLPKASFLKFYLVAQ